MTKMFGPAGMKELGVTTRKGERVLKAGKDGLFNVSDPKLIKKLKAEGMGIASASGVPANAENLGYTCVDCGFGSWFRKCSRCGYETSAPKTDGD